MRVRDISGAVELRFASNVDADLNFRGAGGISLELPDAKVEGRRNPNTLRARIGAGGAPITITGVSGRLWLGRTA